MKSTTEQRKKRDKINYEDEFCITVLARAKEIFGNDATKIDNNKMAMLCCIVANDIGFPLTRGWYK